MKKTRLTALLLSLVMLIALLPLVQVSAAALPVGTVSVNTPVVAVTGEITANWGITGDATDKLAIAAAGKQLEFTVTKVDKDGVESAVGKQIVPLAVGSTSGSVTILAPAAAGYVEVCLKFDWAAAPVTPIVSKLVKVPVDGSVGGKKWVNGSFATNGWEAKGTQYRDFSGNLLANQWAKIDGNWYYFSAAEKVVTGLNVVSGKTYYFNYDGVMQTGWVKLDKNWHYFVSAGDIFQAGWLQVGGTWYYFAGGVMQTGWNKVAGDWYYMNGNGGMVTGWRQVGSEFYYLKSNGVMKTGWLNLSGTWYYLYPSGVMATGSGNIIEGGSFTFNSSGALQ